MTRQAMLAEQIRDSRMMVARYFKGFDDSNHTAQAPGLPNHLAWTLGHLALVLYRSAEKIDCRPVPESDFIKGDGRSGGRDRFDTDSVNFNSKPVADASLYPTFARSVAIFDSAAGHMASTVAAASDAALDGPVKYGKADVPAWLLAARMVLHNGTHCGQIVDLRRALGMGNILG